MVALVVVLGACGEDADPGADENGADATVDASEPADSGPADSGAAIDAGKQDTAAADVPPLSPCQAACEPFLSCYHDLSAEECVTRCEAAKAGDLVPKCTNEATNCVALAKCLGTKPKVARPFDGGTPGTGDWDLAGDFFVPTLRGSLSFSQRWTGADQWFFVVRSGGYSYTENIWKSSLNAALKVMPENVHIVFASFRDKDGSDNAAAHIAEIKAAADAALAKLPEAKRWYWQKRLHFMKKRLPMPSETQGPDHVSGWIADYANDRGRFCFAVDSRQRIRSCGNLRFPPNGSGVTQQLATLQWLARDLNHEDERDSALADEKDVKIVPVFADLGTPSQLVRTVKLPDAAELAKYDTMKIDLRVSCPNHNDSNCAVRSEMVSLALCDLPSATTPASDVACDTEIARWSLPDGREGRWVTDASPALAALLPGGSRKVKLSTPQQTTKNGSTTVFIKLRYDLKLRLSNTGKGRRPTKFIRLWGGQPSTAELWDAKYNPAHADRTIDIPAGAKRVEVFGLISGHGWGIDEANCATFCKQRHTVDVGGKSFALNLDTPGTELGCTTMAGKGMVANQYSNWHYGRAGWCTGMDVRPWVTDITKAVQAGQSAKLTYRALYKGQPYTAKAKAKPSSGGFPAEIQRALYAVIWE